MGLCLEVSVMRDYLTLGSAPYDEDCAQVGQPNFHVRARFECTVYAHQLNRIFHDGDFKVKSFPHDFGSYYEVVIYYDEKSAEYAFEVGHYLPSNWDEESRQQLKEKGYLGE
jgi:hypothetical protein